MQDLISEFGYVGMFIIAFLSSSIMPLASEIFLAAMPALGYNIWISFLAATLGNTLGALLNYYLGLKGGEFAFSRFIKVNPDQLQRSQELFQRWGAPVLILSWVPVVGDPLTVVAGFFRLNLVAFSVWIVLGKALRNLAVLGLMRIFLNHWWSI